MERLWLIIKWYIYLSSETNRNIPLSDQPSITTLYIKLTINTMLFNRVMVLPLVTTFYSFGLVLYSVVTVIEGVHRDIIGIIIIDGQHTTIVIINT